MPRPILVAAVVLVGLIVWSVVAPRPKAPPPKRLVAQVEAVRAGRSTEIELYGESVIDEHLALVADLTSLTKLAIVDGRITAAGVAHLVTLEQLEVLVLTNDGLTGGGMTDASARSLAAKPKLHRLNLGRTDLSDAGLAELAKLPRLEHLRLGSRRITDAGVAHLAKCNTLKHLHVLGDTPLSDAALPPLLELAELQSCYLDSDGLSADGLAKFLADFRSRHGRSVHLHHRGGHLPSDPLLREHRHD